MKQSVIVNITNWLAAPGARRPVTRAAHTMLPSPIAVEAPYPKEALKPEAQQARQSLQEIDPISADVLTVLTEGKPNRFDRRLDHVVSFAGSLPMFTLIMAMVLTWALLGVRFGQENDWQVAISDVQALLCYVIDSLLMRQQLNAYDREVRIAAELQSRALGVQRLLTTLRASRDGAAETGPTGRLPAQRESTDGVRLRPPTYRSHTAINIICDLCGSVPSLVLFWIGMLVWLAFGPHCDWSNSWQLYINSATSALMLVVFGLLTCVREQHRQQMTEQIRQVCEVDAQLELRLRRATGDMTENIAVTIQPPPVGRLERAISYYADLVGTLTGIVLLLLVLVGWLAIGPALKFSSTWWLIIGTYAGLIGLNDGFVLHNVQSQLDRHSQAELLKVLEYDAETFALASIPSEDAVGTFVGSGDLESDQQPEQMSRSRWAVVKAAYSRLRISFSHKLSLTMAHPLAVVTGVVFIVGLLTGASVLRWSLTGQLLCNVPPSIAETFVMMALIARQKSDGIQEVQGWQCTGRNRARLLASLQDVADGDFAESGTHADK